VKGKNSKPHFHVTAGLIWKNGNVLIAKRPKGSHFEGFWEFPGGKQEKGESLRQCLEREIKEELGIKIKAGKLFFLSTHEYNDKVISLHTFACALLAGEPKPLQCQDVKWVNPVRLYEFEFPPPDNLVIEAIRRLR
jgi:mutator protein MutT